MITFHHWFPYFQRFDFFDDNVGYSLLTDSQLSLDFHKLIGQTVQYMKGNFQSKSASFLFHPKKITIRLTDGSEIDTHHNFITLLPIKPPSKNVLLP